MNSFYAETIYTGSKVVPDSYIVLSSRKIVGVSKKDAIELISRRNARILGIDDRVGTLEKGKWASFTCWNGDPFDLTSYPVAVYGEGELLFSA